MRKIFLIVLALVAGFVTSAQTETPTPSKKKDWSKVDLSSRSADHFMFQFGWAGWSGTPDSINVNGFNRTANIYLLFDFPFKSNPRISVGIGLGLGTDNIFFEHTKIDIINNAQVKFIPDTATRYKKYKLNTSYLELPLEIRFSSNPENMNSGFKFAIGGKVGLLMDAKTKAKIEQDINGNSSYTLKEKSKRFFNGSRLAAIARIGYGNFTVFGSYTVTDFIKQGQGPTVKPYSVGLTFSGL